MISICSKCGSKNTRMSRAKGFWPTIRTIFGFYSIRCRSCHHSQTVPFYGISLYARCPQCLREELSDWAEPYRFPPWYERWLVKVGGRAHRCSPCRINFVSFRPRRAQYVPSWRQTGPNERSTPGDGHSPQPIR